MVICCQTDTIKNHLERGSHEELSRLDCYYIYNIVIIFIYYYNIVNIVTVILA